MQNTSLLYKSIMAGSHWTETKLSIGGNDIGEDLLISLSTTKGIFSDSSPTVGGAVSGEIEASFLPVSFTIPRMAQMIPYVRISNGTQTSEWIQKGVFYIDTRETTQDANGNRVTTLHGYDAMLKAEVLYGASALSYPATDIQVVTEIASKMGVPLDARTTAFLTNAYSIQYPAQYTLRETLGYIAAMYGGCAVMSDLGELWITSFYSIPPETNCLIDNAGYAITFGGDRILV